MKLVGGMDEVMIAKILQIMRLKALYQQPSKESVLLEVLTRDDR
jgi:hypothetical protein